MKKEVAIGIDIGGTNTDYGIVDRQGKCLSAGSMKTNEFETAAPFLDKLAENLKLQIAGLKGKYDIKGIGVGAPNGNYYTGNIEFAPNLKWKGKVRIATMLEKRMGLPVILTNDANAAAMGEMMYGAAKGMKDFIVITLGTGLGSGIVINGELVYGHDGFAGELGHTVVYPKGRLCGCGKRGCLETYVSATGITETVKFCLKNSDAETILRKLPAAKINSHEIFLAAKKRDDIAILAFDYTAEILGMKLADAVAFSSPEAIFLFGGLAKSGDYIFKPTKKYMEHYLLPIFRKKVKLLPSLLVNDNAAVLGASALVWKK